MNPDWQEQLARACGLGTDSSVEAMLAALRSPGAADPEQLRRGCVLLLEHLRDSQREHSRVDERLRIAVEASNLGLWDWEISSGKVFVDRHYCNFIGRGDRDEVISLEELSAITHPEDLAEFTEGTKQALRGQGRFHVAHRVRHADGRWVWIETYGDVTQRDANGRATRMTGTHANITERKQLERALSNTLRVMHALLETLPIPVVIRDAERRVTLVNAAWETMRGLPRAEMIGRRLDEGRSGVPNKRFHDTDDELFEHKRPLRYETSIQTANGGMVDVLVAKTLLFAEDGTVTGVASVLTDISEQNRAAAALERARQSAEAAMHAKSRFLANMSHELRTPLNGVVGMASLLENTALDAKQRRFVRTLKNSAEALVTLINDVLDLSKAEAGKLEITHAPFELRRELEQVIGLFGARAYAKDLEIAAHIARDVPRSIRGDPLRLRQVLGNLVNNAVKFTESGAVLVSVGVVPGDGAACQLEFAVTDTGVGVGPGEQARIFEAFEQADGSVTRRFGGTGLGLAISRQLVELMGGAMHLQSEPGHGSRFSFRVPAGVPRAVTPPATPSTEDCVLVVGLHALLGRAICEAVSASNAQVVSCESTREAVDALNALSAQIRRVRVIIDSNAAAKLELAANSLRAAAGARTLEVVALLPPDADATPAPGITRSMVKPIITDDLAAAAAPDPAQSMRVRVLQDPPKRGRALVVEDNAVNQEMARAMLDMLGFSVVTAANGREGVDAFAANPGLALILMDCQMPVMDGLAATRAIRAAEPTGIRVPIVALTGNAMPGDREACLAAGMDDYLAKPFSLSALRTMLDKWAGPATDGGPSKARR